MAIVGLIKIEQNSNLTTQKFLISVQGSIKQAAYLVIIIGVSGRNT